MIIFFFFLFLCQSPTHIVQHHRSSGRRRHCPRRHKKTPSGVSDQEIKKQPQLNFLG
jgi:hypothetical protein